MYNITKKNYDTFDRIIDSFFNEPIFQASETNWKYKNQRLAIEVLEDKAVVALSVLGYGKDDISIELHEDVIYVKSADKELNSVEKELISKINDRITVGANFDGERAEAKVLNGILYLSIPKKEEAKPKKVTIKVG